MQYNRMLRRQDVCDITGYTPSQAYAVLKKYGTPIGGGVHNTHRAIAENVLRLLIKNRTIKINNSPPAVQEDPIFGKIMLSAVHASLLPYSHSLLPKHKDSIFIADCVKEYTLYLTDKTLKSIIDEIIHSGVLEENDSVSRKWQEVYKFISRTYLMRGGII